MNIGLLSPFNPAEFKEYLPGFDLPSIGKTASSVNALVYGLLQAGINVHVFTCAPSESRDFMGTQLKVTIINNEYPIIGSSRNNRLFLHNRIIKAINGYVKNFDLLHAQWTYEYARAASHFSSNMPVFCTVRDWCPFIIKCQKKLTDRLFWSVTSNYVFKKVFEDRHIHFIANSEYTLQSIKNKYPCYEIDIVNNPIQDRFIRTDQHHDNVHTVFVCIAQAVSEPRKNIHNLLISFQVYLNIDHTAKLKLVGRDCIAGNETIESFRTKGLLKNVELCGFVNHDELMILLDSCDVLVHPSIEETFGNILIEGMARKLLVIGGEHAGAVPLVLDKGKAGILCDVTDVNSIVNALLKATDPIVRKPILEYASQLVIEKYSSSNIARKQISLYNKYLDRHVRN